VTRLVLVVAEATAGLRGVEAYRAAFMVVAEAYHADPPAGWDLLSPVARVAMIEGATRVVLEESPWGAA
jgi:hypothetical protein